MSAAWLDSFVAAIPATRRLLKNSLHAAATARVLVLRGAPGTGRTLLARVLHAHAAPEMPLAIADASMLRPEAAAHELFRPGGLWESSAGAALLIEDAALLPPEAQARLYRRLREKLAGGLRGPARLYVCTSTAAGSGADQKELLQALGGSLIQIPTLRERAGDIRPLLHAWMERLAAQQGREPLTFAADALAALEHYTWPGNVRELRETLERMLLHVQGAQLLLQHLPPQIRNAAMGGGQKKLSLEELERVHIADVLEYTRGRKTRAAQILGISRKTLLEKRKRYGLS